MTLGTAPEYRKLGLATMLVKQCIQDMVLPHPGCGALYLHVITTNPAAIAFYEQDSLRFHRVKEIPNYYTIDDEFHNCYLYAKYFHGTYNYHPCQSSSYKDRAVCPFATRQRGGGHALYTPITISPYHFQLI